MSNETVLIALVIAAIVAVYLLRHVIALAIRLIILGALVLGGYWAWQHRAELIDAAEPYLGGFGDRFRDLDPPALMNLLDGLDPSEERSAPDDAGSAVTTGIVQEFEDLRGADGGDDPTVPDGPADPAAP